MNKISNRAIAVLLISVAVIFGLVVYTLNYIDHGREWALYFSRANSDSTGQVLDRNGVVLASFDALENRFADDELTRKANYHVTGDYWGRTGTGVLSAFWTDIQDFSLATGTTRAQAKTLTLNIDSKLNNIIYSKLPEGSKAAVLVVNYKTGQLLGMVSAPTVDPMDSEAEPADGAYINRCLSAAFVPGSVFKLVTAAAAIESVDDLYNMSFYCGESYDIAGVDITCPVDHGNQTFEQAMANSCNCSFARIAVMTGQNELIEHVREYGFLDTHELDGISTAAGNYPLEFVGDPELAWSGIGQSTDLVCPYSLLRYVSALANGGVLVEPRLLHSEEQSVSSRLVEADTADKLASLMSYNVFAHYGGEEAFPNLSMCAKTGTAEVGDGTTHAWFAGFLDDDSHPYAFVTMIEQGGGGLGVAGTLTNQIFQEYFFQ